MAEKQELMLVDVATEFKNSVAGLEELSERVSNLPTEQLATGYAMIKAYEKNFDGLIKAVRDEFIGTQDADKNYNKDGRLFKETDEKDGKGNPILELPDGTTLKASKSSKNTFNEDLAAEVLEDYGMTEMGSDAIYQVNDAESLAEGIAFAMARLEKEDAEQFLKIMNTAIKSDYKPSQEKIEALITTGQLPTESVEGMFETKDTYSLLVSKNPYKPKKK